MRVINCPTNNMISRIIRRLQGNDLAARSTRGVITLGVGTFTERGLKLVRNMILARLLAPSEFGLMAIIFAVTMALEAFAEVGVRQSVIHSKRGDKAEYLNVAWWFQGVRGLGLFIVAFFMAPWISYFYKKPEFVTLMRVAFTSLLFNSFISPRVHVLEKKIKFSKWVFLFQGSGLLGTLVTLSFAFFLIRNVWALVIGYVAEAMFICLLSFFLCPFIPRVHIDKHSLSDIWKYAHKMFGIAVLAVIAFQMDVFVLGKVVSDEKIGMYWLASLLALQINTLYFRIIRPILLPVFAEKQEDKQSICSAVMTVTTWAGVFGVPITTFLVVCASPVLSIFYGSEYQTVAIPFGLLCIYALIRLQGSNLVQTYFAIGEPNLQRRFVILRLVILACLLYPSTILFGLVGAAAVVLLANFIGLCMQVIWLRKPIGLRFKKYIGCWIPGLQTAIIVLVPILLLQLLQKDSLVLSITVGGLACLAACITGLFLLVGKAKRYSVPLERSEIG